MASKEEQAKILEAMREKERQQQEVAKRTGRAPLGGKVPQEEPKAKAKQQEPTKEDTDLRVKQLEEQLKKLKEEKEDLSDQLDSQAKAKDAGLKQQALADIVQNNDDTHFVKEYEFDVKNPDRTTKVYVKMHAPSALDEAQIQSEIVDMTNGEIQGYARYAQELFMAVAFFRVVGDNVPIYLTDLSQIYRQDIILTIWQDYQEWLLSFQETLTH